MTLLLGLAWMALVTTAVCIFAWLVVKYDLPRPRREKHPHPGE